MEGFEVGNMWSSSEWPHMMKSFYWMIHGVGSQYKDKVGWFLVGMDDLDQPKGE